MKPLICPISPESIDQHIPRIIALCIIILTGTFIISGFWFILAFLITDFYIRGFSNGKYSLLTKTATGLSTILNLRSAKTNKAPKIFAAKLGFIFVALIMLAHFSGLTLLSISFSALLILLAAIEGILNFCIGCHLYTYIILPYFNNKNATTD